MWRWPLSIARWFREGLWWFCYRIPGLLGVVALLALYPSVGLGAAAAIVQALVLMAIFTAPVAALLFVIDSATMLRCWTATSSSWPCTQSSTRPPATNGRLNLGTRLSLDGSQQASPAPEALWA